MRLPPPTLPFFGDSLSLVLFHDMGNIFANAGDAWESALRFHQPDRAACVSCGRCFWYCPCEHAKQGLVILTNRDNEAAI